MFNSREIMEKLEAQFNSPTGPKACDSCDAEVKPTTQDGITIVGVYHDDNCPALAEHNDRKLNRKQRRNAKNKK